LESTATIGENAPFDIAGSTVRDLRGDVRRESFWDRNLEMQISFDERARARAIKRSKRNIDRIRIDKQIEAR